MEESGRKKNGLAAGWVLVTGLLTLCLLGTGLTWWNYSRQVFSTARGVVVKTGGLCCVSAPFPLAAAGIIRQGHRAKVTQGNHSEVMEGEVLSVTPGTHETIVLVTLSRETAAGAVDHPAISPPQLPAGALCGVSIDTTVPPVEKGKSGESASSPESSSSHALGGPR